MYIYIYTAFNTVEILTDESGCFMSDSKSYTGNKNDFKTGFKTKKKPSCMFHNP